MDAVDQTLQATERLLKALQEDRPAPGESPFVDRLTDLRTKHKETTEYLSQLWAEESRYHSVPHTTCRQWAVHHCPSERMADPCPNEYPAPSRPVEFVIHHRPSEYTIHHRPSEYKIHQLPRGYTEEPRPRHSMEVPHPSDYPGPPRPSEYAVYRSTRDFKGDYHSTEFTVDDRLRETSVQRVRSEYTADYPSGHPLAGYAVQYRPGTSSAGDRPQKVPRGTRSSEYYPHDRPMDYSTHPPGTDYPFVNIPPGSMAFRTSMDDLAQQGSSDLYDAYDQYLAGTTFDQAPKAYSAYSTADAPATVHRSRTHLTQNLPHEDSQEQHLHPLQDDSPKDKSHDEKSSDHRPTTSTSQTRPKPSSAQPRKSVPTVHPRLRERVASLPTRPTVQDAADMLHLAAKAKAKKREERARAREKETALEKVDEKREESIQTEQEESGIKEERTSSGKHVADHVPEKPARKHSKTSETEMKHAKKKDKANGRTRDKSSKRIDSEEERIKSKEDSSRRVEFKESDSKEEVEPTENDSGRNMGDRVMDENQGDEPTPVKTRPPRPKSAKGTRESKRPIPHSSSTKRDVVPEPIQNFVPQVTVPVPFKFTTRKPIINKYSTKFVKEMVSRKKQEQEEEEIQASKTKPFVAQAVPKSTYVSTNPLVSEKAYVEAIRRRLTATMRKHFEQEALSRRSKSLGDLSVRPVPITTYVAPTMPDYRRSRNTHQRSVQLLVEASTPPVLREHTIRTHVSTKVRHLHCTEEQTGERHTRPPIPDFQRLHAEMENALKSAPHKATTVPRPFHLTEANAFRHRHCKSSSPPRWRAQNIRRMSKGDIAIRPTHSSTIRTEAIRQRQEKLSAERHRSEKFWEDRRDEMDLSRMRLLSSMGSLPNVNEEIERKTAEKIRHITETTRDYERFLVEMQQRVIDRPLIMERQSIIAQKQKFARKYEERLAAVGKTSTKVTDRLTNGRHDSDVSGATYSVISREQTEVAGNGYGSGDFESEEETQGVRKRSSSSASSSTSSSSSETSSKSSSSKKLQSSGTSEASSSSKNETNI